MRRIFILLALSAALAAAAPAGAAVISAEDFESYAAGSQLESSAGVGLNGGTGWAGAWSIDNDTYRSRVTIVAKSMGYDSGTGIHVDGGGQALRIKDINDQGNFVLASRQMSAAQSAAVYYSFLFSTTSADGSTDTDFTQFGLDAAANTNPRVSVGHDSTASLSPKDFTFFARSGTTGGAFMTTGTTVEPAQYFVVVKASKVASTKYNRVDMWVNPTSLAEPATASATTSGVDSGLTSVSYFATRVARLETGDTYYIDELRVGDTYASVLPEPATLALLALGGLGVLARRKK